MSARTPSDEAVLSALTTALAPYPWRGFTPELLARLGLAARDRVELAAVLAGVHGAAVGTWDRLEPAERADARVPPIVEFLADLRWTELSLPGICRHLVGVLGAERR